MFQGSQHPQVNADASQRQDPHRPKEGCCLPLGIPSRWLQVFLCQGDIRALGERVKEHCKSST